MAKAISLNEHTEMVRRAVHQMLDGMRNAETESYWDVLDVYEDDVVVRDYAEVLGYYRVPYQMIEGQCQVAERAEWTEVEKEWVERKMLDAPVTFSAPLKALGDGKVGGYLVVFGDEKSTDLEGEFFTAETDFDIEDDDRITVYYQHGLDPVLKGRVLGRGVVRRDDVGVWMEAQLKLRDEYEQFIYRQVEAGKMGLSSGTLPNLVERVPRGGATWIKRWPLGKDGSITPTPAEPRASVVPLKTLLTAATGEPPQPSPGAQGGEAPRGDGRAGAQAARISGIKTHEEGDMPEPTTTPTDGDRIAALEGQFDKIAANLEKVLKYMEDAPALRGAAYSVDGGSADPDVKSFGDFLLAVRRQDSQRLAKVYRAIKDMAEDSGTTGGYLIPAEFQTTLLRVGAMASPILSRIQVVRVSAPAGKWPALDNYVTPTAGSGNTALAAGVVATTTPENTPITETEPGIEMIEWRVNAVKGVIPVGNELKDDSPEAIEALLTSIIGIAVAAKRERHVLRGNGAGEPLGILNAGCAIGITPATNNVFSYADALQMKSRFKNVTGREPVWIIHPGIWPDIGVFEVSAGSGGVFAANLSGPLPERLLGYGVTESEHLPQDDNAGAVILADLFAYILWERGGLSIAYSEHAGFEDDQVKWRFRDRIDGQPWMRAALTLADPQGSYTVSPFVYHND